jgi:hypothetical protein
MYLVVFVLTHNLWLLVYQSSMSAYARSYSHCFNQVRSPFQAKPIIHCRQGTVFAVSASEAVELAEAEPPRTASYTVSISMDAGAKVAAAEVLGPEKTHLRSGYGFLVQKSRGSLWFLQWAISEWL